MRTVREEPADSPDAIALLRYFFAELTVRYFRRATTEEEIDLTLVEFPTAGLAAFFVLRADGEPAGCLGLHPQASSPASTSHPSAVAEAEPEPSSTWVDDMHLLSFLAPAGGDPWGRFRELVDGSRR